MARPAISAAATGCIRILLLITLPRKLMDLSTLEVRMFLPVVRSESSSLVRAEKGWVMKPVLRMRMVLGPTKARTTRCLAGKWDGQNEACLCIMN